MPAQTWEALLNWGAPWQTASGAALSTGTLATISPQGTTGQDFSLLASYWNVGTSIKVTARGLLTTTSTSTTLAVNVAANANNAGTYVNLATTASFNTGTGSFTGLQWKVEAVISCTALGSTGTTMETQGEMTIPTSATAPTIGTANLSVFPMPSVSGETTAAVNTFVPQGLALRATLGAANATIQCTQFLLEG